MSIFSFFNTIIKPIKALFWKSPPAPEEVNEATSVNLLKNLENFRKLTAVDVKTPRSDLIAMSIKTEIADILNLFQRHQLARLLVYRDHLDEMLGYVHIRSLLAHAPHFENFSLEAAIEKVLFVAPSMPVMDLVLHMRATKMSVAIVVDEYGGVDGVITDFDILTELLLKLSETHIHIDDASIVRVPGGWIVEGRVLLEELEKETGELLSDAEKEEEDIETIGGFVSFIAGRVPMRREIIFHSNGRLCFEILEADPRRIQRIKIIRTATEQSDEPLSSDIG